jgi:prolyl 4-hydroxylase
MTLINQEYKYEKYSLDPFVCVYEDVMSPDECNHFINIAKNNLKRATVTESNEGIISEGRTGSNTWISHNHDNITLKVGEKIAKILDMPLENAESFQIIHYNKGEEYKSHYDSWVHDYSEKTLRCMKWGGARLKTAICYLSSVEQGGGTEMTKLNTIIQAKKGRMLLFENTYKNSHVRHPLSQHRGMPVIIGEKYAFNLFFRECNRNILYSEFNPNYYERMKLSKKINSSINNNDKNEKSQKWLYNDLDIHKEKKLVVNNKIISQENINKKFLEIGDFFPFIKIGGKEIYNLVNNKFILIINSKKKIKNISDLSQRFNIVFRNSSDNVYNIIPDLSNEMYILLLSPNRRIKAIINDENILFNLDLSRFKEVYNLPFIKIENALDEELLNDIKKFYYEKKNNGETLSHSHLTKDRLHVHPDIELTKRIDNKLSRSVLPELMKVFYFNVKYREDYKICSYNSETSGRFHAHRDTPTPHQHRKYAMSLLLNDDYKGGELYLPEYDIHIKPKSNTAIIFPGICSHQVLEVTQGFRMAIITFFSSDLKEGYRMKSHFFDENNIEYSNIYPL